MDRIPSEADYAAGALRQRLGSDAFLEALPIGIYCCDRDGIIRQFNRRAAEIWGRTPRIGDPDQRFCGAQRLLRPDGEALPHDRTPMAECLRTGKPARDQRVLIERPDGSRVAALVNIEPLVEADGTLIGAVNCFQDVTEVVAANERLRTSQTQFEDFFENSAVGLHIVGPDGIIQRANDAELALLGYAREEYVGRPITEFHADQEVIADILGKLGRGEQVDRQPARLRTKDGSIRHVLITSNGRFDGDRLQHTRCFTIDVTDAWAARDRLREREARFRDLLQALPAAIYTTDAEGRVTFYNEAAVALAGRRPMLGSDEWCVTWRLFHVDGSPMPHELCPMAKALKEQRPVRGEEAIAERPDGSRVRFVPYPTPLFDANGRLAGAVNLLLDVTEQREAEAQSAHLAAIVASSNDAIISKTLQGGVRSWNSGAARIFGYTADEMVGQPILRIIPEELQSEEEEILAKLRRGERIEHFETQRLRKDGRRIDISLTISPILNKAGQVIGASKVARDISERKRAEAVQQLLMSELNHRVKNTLATVQAMASQTVRRAATPADFAVSFSGRLQSLARTHDQLTQSAWTGADLGSLARDQLVLGAPDNGRIAFAGPQVLLEPQAALHLALVLHELGTNARKHGALSVHEGRVALHWEVRSTGAPGSRELKLHWQESGGPTVSVPTSYGFGTTLIEKSLSAHGGSAILHYGAHGVACDITLPLAEPTTAGVFATPAHDGAGSAEPAAHSSLRGRRVLVVEDEALIALDVAATLEDAGCIVVGPASTLEKARSEIATSALDAALLDANLAGQPVDELAAALAARGVPFAFLTGYGRAALPVAHRHAPLIRKPFVPREAIDVLGRMLAPDNRVISLRPKGHGG